MRNPELNPSRSSPTTAKWKGHTMRNPELNRTRDDGAVVHLGDRVKVIDQDIHGEIVRWDGGKAIVLDDDAAGWMIEDDDGTLVFSLSDLVKGVTMRNSELACDWCGDEVANGEGVMIDDDRVCSECAEHGGDLAELGMSS